MRNRHKQNNYGIYIGVESQEPVILDSHDMNSNKDINYIEIAKVGTGMSFSCKSQMLDSVNNYTHAIVIDPKSDLDIF